MWIGVNELEEIWAATLADLFGQNAELFFLFLARRRGPEVIGVKQISDYIGSLNQLTEPLQ